MNTRFGWISILVLTAIVGILAYLLFTIPAAEDTPSGISTTTSTESDTETPSGDAPMHERVWVTSPKSGASVGKTFVVAGSAPGPWFFEASFPVQVIDKDGNKIASTFATAQGDWMTTDLVTFTSNVTISGSYTGPATLVLLKDNPSGLPEHDDALEIPIVIQ